jgi:hypothetical protein
MATRRFSSLECKELKGILRQKKRRKKECRVDAKFRNTTIWLVPPILRIYDTHSLLLQCLFFHSMFFLSNSTSHVIARFCSWQILSLSHSQTIDQHVCQHSLSRVNFVGPQR